MLVIHVKECVGRSLWCNPHTERSVRKASILTVVVVDGGISDGVATVSFGAPFGAGKLSARVRVGVVE